MWLCTPSYGGGGGDAGGSDSSGIEAKKARAVMGRPRKTPFFKWSQGSSSEIFVPGRVYKFHGE
eukprot:1423876-Pleurochrysis_carterae.AAC.1